MQHGGAHRPAPICCVFPVGLALEARPAICSHMACHCLPRRLLTFLLILLLLALAHRTASTGLAMRRAEQQAQRHLSPLPGDDEQQGQQQLRAAAEPRRRIRRHSRPPSPKLVVELSSLDGQVDGQQKQKQRPGSGDAGAATGSSPGRVAGGAAGSAWQIPSAAAAVAAAEQDVQQEEQQSAWQPCLGGGSPRRCFIPKRPVSAPPAAVAGMEGQQQHTEGSQKQRARSSLDALGPVSPPRYDGPAVEQASSAGGSSNGGSSSDEEEDDTAAAAAAAAAGKAAAAVPDQEGSALLRWLSAPMLLDGVLHRGSSMPPAQQPACHATRSAGARTGVGQLRRHAFTGRLGRLDFERQSKLQQHQQHQQWAQQLCAEGSNGTSSKSIADWAADGCSGPLDAAGNALPAPTRLRFPWLKLAQMLLLWLVFFGFQVSRQHRHLLHCSEYPLGLISTHATAPCLTTPFSGWLPQLGKGQYARPSWQYGVLFGAQTTFAMAAAVFFSWQAFRDPRLQRRSEPDASLQPILNSVPDSCGPASGAGDSSEQPASICSNLPASAADSAPPAWTARQLAIASAVSLAGGAVAGTLGLGGGMVMGPLLLGKGMRCIYHILLAGDGLL